MSKSFDNSDFKHHIDQVADLVREFKLTEAELEVDGFKISLKKSAPKVAQSVVLSHGEIAHNESALAEHSEEPTPPAPVNHGTPITSPMMGIFYTASGPSAPPFVKEGDTITAGQVIGLIEAMKVYSEIHASTSGVVKKLVAENGAILNPGDVILYIG